MDKKSGEKKEINYLLNYNFRIPLGIPNAVSKIIYLL